MLASLVALALASTVADTPATAPQKSVAVHLIERCATRADCVPRGVVRQMQDEASRIWSSLDVRITWIDSANVMETNGAVVGLTVMLEGSAQPDLRRRLQRGLVLAVIYQPDMSCGSALARVWVKHARRHASSVRHDGIPPGGVPGTLADLYLARALGRALAHEIGHYLLGHARHMPDGLMRERFTPQELLIPTSTALSTSTGLYGLDRHSREALRSCRMTRVGPITVPTP